MLIDDDIPSLDSLEPEGALGFDERLAALENSFEEVSRRIEQRILNRIQHIEDVFVAHEDERRRDLLAERTARQEQISSLAGKLCRCMDNIEFALPAAKGLPASASPPTHLTALVYGRVEEAREQLSQEVAELREEFQALLESSRPHPGK